MRWLILILVPSLILFSCSREKEVAGPPPAAEKTIFEEVKEQTIKNPRDAEAWFHLGDLYDRSDMYKEAAEAFSKALEIDPSKGYTYVKLGTAYNRLQRYQDAVRQFVKGKKYLPKYPLLYNNLGVAYGRLGKTGEEIASLQKAISLNPHYSSARYNLGMAYLRQGKRELAQKQYQELLGIDVTAAQSLKKELDAKGK